MESVRLHLDGTGVLWLLAQCRTCRNVHKYLASDAAAAPVRCKSCGMVMKLEGAMLQGCSSEAPSRP